MRSGPTYGELLDETARNLNRATNWTIEPFDRGDGAAATLAAHGRFVTAIRRHLLLLLGSRRNTGAEEDAAVIDLIRALEPWCAVDRHEPAAPVHPAGIAWARAAESLRLAHDLLASHLGPDRQWLTPDSHLIDEPRARRETMALLGALALTDAAAARPLGLRVAEARPDLKTRRAAERLLVGREQVVAAATELPAVGATVGRPGEMAGLRPVLRALPRLDASSDPLTAAVTRVDWLAQRAHDLARGSAEVGAVTMQAFAVLGVSVHQHSAVILSAAAARAGDLLPKESRGGLSARWAADAQCARTRADAWRRIYQAWDGLATPAPGSRLVVQQVTETRRSLADVTRASGQWKAPDVLLPDVRNAERLLDAVDAVQNRMRGLEACHEAIASRSEVQAQVYMPRREAPPEADLMRLVGPWRYVPATKERLDGLGLAYAGLGRD